MNDLIRIPCVLMRGGTSKGPFFLARDLPLDPIQRDALLIEVMGSGHALEICLLYTSDAADDAPRV